MLKTKIHVTFQSDIHLNEVKFCPRVMLHVVKTVVVETVLHDANGARLSRKDPIELNSSDSLLPADHCLDEYKQEN